MDAQTPVSRSPEVDAYLAKVQPFARPILTYLRETVHEVCPEVTESIKWSMPFFSVRGVILANMAGHKAHASFGLWGKEVVARLAERGIAAGGTMGSFGRIESVGDLPPKETLQACLREAAALIMEGTRTQSIQRVAKPARIEDEVPAALAQALKTNAVAARKFAEFSPSCRREYTEWINAAKREETRSKRIATALEWISEGKSRNWKYERSA